MSQTYTLKFRFPPGVQLQQHTDGLQVLVYSVDSIAPLRESLGKLSSELIDQAVNDVKRKREEEKKRHQMPVDRLAVLDGEIAALEAQRQST